MLSLAGHLTDELGPRICRRPACRQDGEGTRRMMTRQSPNERRTPAPERWLRQHLSASQPINPTSDNTGVPHSYGHEHRL